MFATSIHRRSVSATRCTQRTQLAQIRSRSLSSKNKYPEEMVTPGTRTDPPKLQASGCKVRKPHTNPFVDQNAIPCPATKADTVAALQGLVGSWVGLNRNGGSVFWEIELPTTGSARNKAITNDYVMGGANGSAGPNQCIQFVNYYRTETNSSGDILRSENGMLLFDFSSAHLATRNFSLATEESGVPTTTSVFIRPNTAGAVLWNKTKKTISKAHHWSDSGNNVLQMLPDGDVDFICDSQLGSVIRQSSMTIEQVRKDLSFCLARVGGSLYISENILGHISTVQLQQGPATFVPRPAEPENPQMKEWNDTIEALLTTSDKPWTSPVGKALSISQLPGATTILTNFFSCFHANLNQLMFFTRNPYTAKNAAVQVIDYHQRLTDNTPQQELIHEELGFLVFNWNTKKVTRHGVLPHGSTFAMQGTLQSATRSVVSVPSTPTLPTFAPDFKRLVRNGFAQPFLAGLDTDNYEEAPTVPLRDSAQLLQQANGNTVFDDVKFLDLSAGASMDLEFVDSLNTKTNRKFINALCSKFWLLTKDGKTTLQYTQEIQWDFPSNVPGVGGEGIDNQIRWPHVQAAILTKE